MRIGNLVIGAGSASEPDVGVPSSLIASDVEVAPFETGVRVDLRHQAARTTLAIGMAAAALRAERCGCDAAFINSTSDYGLQKIRAFVDMPVVGSGEAGAVVAASIGQRFAIVQVWPEWSRWLSARAVISAGAGDRCCSIRNVTHERRGEGRRGRDAPRRLASAQRIARAGRRDDVDGCAGRPGRRNPPRLHLHVRRCTLAPRTSGRPRSGSADRRLPRGRAGGPPGSALTRRHSQRLLSCPVGANLQIDRGCSPGRATRSMATGPTALWCARRWLTGSVSRPPRCRAGRRQIRLRAELAAVARGGGARCSRVCAGARIVNRERERNRGVLAVRQHKTPHPGWM